MANLPRGEAELKALADDIHKRYRAELQPVIRALEYIERQRSREMGEGPATVAIGKFFAEMDALSEEARREALQTTDPA